MTRRGNAGATVNDTVVRFVLTHSMGDTYRRASMV